MASRAVVYSVRIEPPQPKFLLFQSLPQTLQPSEFVWRSGDSRKLRLETLPMSHAGHGMIDSFRFAVIQELSRFANCERLLVVGADHVSRFLIGRPPGAFAVWAFKIRSTESIVFQLRVVAGAPKSLSIWPR